MNEGPTIIPGRWQSSYFYPSTSRGGTFTSQHDVTLSLEGSRLAILSLPSSPSRLTMDLAVEGRVITGTWREVTDPDGHYRGVTYHGAVQFLLDADSRRMTGKWVGYGKDGEMNIGDWSLTLAGSREEP